MYLKDVTASSFIIFNDTVSVKNTLEFIANLKKDLTHIIVKDTNDDYYLFQKDWIKNHIEFALESETLHKALNISKQRKTSLLSGFSSADKAPSECIVEIDGKIIGIKDESSQYLDGNETLSTPMGDIIIAEFPDEVTIDETHNLTVYLSGNTIQENFQGLENNTNLDISVSVKNGFTVTGESDKKLTFKSDGKSESLTFPLKAIKEGIGRIGISAFSKGKPAGYVDIGTRVISRKTNEVHTSVINTNTLRDIEYPYPDLTMIITNNGENKYQIILTQKEIFTGIKRYDLLPVKTNPEKYVRTYYSFINDLAGSPGVLIEKMKSVGNHFYNELFPDTLKKDIWDLKDRINSVMIYSDEPWLPWELCRIHTENQDGFFFCEKFEVSRWLSGIDPGNKIDSSNIALIMPKSNNLKCVEEERTFFKTLISPNCNVAEILSTYMQVKKEMSNGVYTIWHFSGHGYDVKQDPNLNMIKLDDGVPLSPIDITGDTTNLGNTHPLIFFNGCETGTGGMSLTQPGGWAKQFITAGAAAYIGTYWKVFDKSASEFSKTFYTELIKNKKPIGEAVKKARLSLKSSGNSTWLAYTLFAHPLIRVED